MAFRLATCKHGNKQRSCRICRGVLERLEERDLGPDEPPQSTRWRRPADWLPGTGPGMDDVAEFVGDLGAECTECVAGFVYKPLRIRRWKSIDGRAKPRQGSIVATLGRCPACSGTGVVVRVRERLDPRYDPFEHEPLNKVAQLRFGWDP